MEPHPRYCCFGVLVAPDKKPLTAEPTNQGCWNNNMFFLVMSKEEYKVISVVLPGVPKIGQRLVKY